MNLDGYQARGQMMRRTLSFKDLNKRKKDGSQDAGSIVSNKVISKHAPIINLMIFYGYATKTLDVIVALALTVTMAIISWLCLERIAIRKKKRPSMNMDAGSDPASQTHLG